MKISNALLAETMPLPPIGDLVYQYVVAANGLFIRAEDSRIEACVPIIRNLPLRGLVDVETYARLKVDRVPGVWLRSVLASARRRMPNEAMYQFHFGGETHKSVTHTWRCSSPAQITTPTGIKFDDDGQAVIDLHSHNSMDAFFSSTDDDDEGGLRFYAVIGKIDTAQPEIRVRVGVYGHHMTVPAELVFDGLGPFVEAIDTVEEVEPVRTCRVCGCTDADGCANGCFWVDDDLCSNCGEVPPSRLNEPVIDVEKFMKP